MSPIGCFLVDANYEVGHTESKINMSSMMANNRPKKRNHEISIRVSEHELQKLHERKSGMTLAGWMRNLGLGVTPMKPADPELVRALGRIGSNLNQLTKHVNIDKQVDENVLEQIKAIRASIDALLDEHLRGEA